MKRTVLLLAFLCSNAAIAQQEETYDYFGANREMIRNGVQAILMCNGLYTSNRPLRQVYRHELAYLTPERFGGPVGTPEGGEYETNDQLKAVAIGGPTTGPTIRAALSRGRFNDLRCGHRLRGDGTGSVIRRYRFITQT